MYGLDPDRKDVSSCRGKQARRVCVSWFEVIPCQGKREVHAEGGTKAPMSPQPYPHCRVLVGSSLIAI